MTYKQFTRKINNMRVSRFLHRCYAFLFGYFWIPCPLCGKYFGGHEWLVEDSLWINERDAEAVCPNCSERVKIINKRNNFHNRRLI